MDYFEIKKAFYFILNPPPSVCGVEPPPPIAEAYVKNVSFFFVLPILPVLYGLGRLVFMKEDCGLGLGCRIE